MEVVKHHIYHDPGAWTPEAEVSSRDVGTREVNSAHKTE